MPAMLTVLSEPDASEQVPPLFASVIVTRPLAVVAVAEHCAKPDGRVIVGAPGTVNAGSNCTNIRCPAARVVPAELGRNVADQVDVAPPVCGAPLNATLVGDVAPVMTTSLAGDAARESVLVRTEKFASG
jgi:hypothetical protein